MPATITAPPPAPAKTPSPSPAPAPKPAGSPVPASGRPSPPVVDTEKVMTDYLGDIGSELEGLDATEEASKKEATKQRDEKGKFVKPEETKEEPQKKEETEVPEQSEKVEKPEEPKPGTMRALGKAYDEQKKRINDELQPKIQSLTSKVSEYERTIEELKKSAPDLRPVQERMQAIEKENAALREEIRFVNYKKHPEFTEKYEKPYNEAWSKAVSEVTQLNLEMEDGTTRKATANDLLALANAPLDQLDDLANKWFPRSSARVVRHVEKIRDLAEAQDKALEDAKKGAVEFDSRRTVEQQARDAEIAKTYQDSTAELVKKYPKWFDKDETDPAGNEILQKGFEYASGVFENTPVTINGQTRPLTPVEKVRRLAVIKAKAANHDRLASRLKARDARIAELEAKLAEFEKSEPPTDDAGSPSTSKNGFGIDEIEAELRKLDR